MAEAPAVTAVGPGAADWRRLSPWSMLHFAARAIVQSIQGLVVAAPATYGAAQSPLAAYAWTIPVGVLIAIAASAVLGYLYYFYRLSGDAVEVKRGFLFKKRLNLAFTRVQNINLEDPFYFRPLGLVTLKLDSAGSAGDEVHLAALVRAEAEALRTYILRRKLQLGGDERLLAAVDTATPPAEEVCFTRSVEDLVVHGLTNNRAYLAIAGIMGLVWQMNLPVADLAAGIGIDLDLIMGSTLGWLALLFALAFIGTGAVIAALSVAVAVIVYYGFTVYRSGDRLGITRGLLTRHETHVQTSRIQAVVIKQDWLEFLIGRSNVVFEQISHRSRPGNDWQSVRQKILVPSVRDEEIATLTGEALDWRRLQSLEFTPISRRYFRKHAAIWTGVYAAALVAGTFTPIPFPILAPALLVLWALHVWAIHMTWKRAGLAVDGGIVVARYGTVGVNYHVFHAFKIQSASSVQSVLMRRKDVSDVLLRTAASRTKVPYVATPFAKAVIDYCVFTVEECDKSWM